ncbi:MAG TPA: hypothetical protein VHE61_05620, partial [Opitutaceae bacterium]|nr:hypothetical protein [Opitutaceae bacterium]
MLPHRPVSSFKRFPSFHFSARVLPLTRFFFRPFPKFQLFRPRPIARPFLLSNVSQVSTFP